jgi:O-antigen ligase
MNDSGLEEGYRSIYLSIPYYLGVAILFLSYEYKNLKSINTKKFIMLNILFFIALLASGARGPLLALLISLLILHYRSFVFHMFLLASGSFFILLFYSFSNSTYTPEDSYLFLIQRFFNRFNKLFEGGVADNPRNELYTYTFNKLDTFSLEQFIGRGTGSFGTLYHHRDMDMHPHNLFLEVWFENGLIGMLILLIIFISFSLRFISYGKFSVSIFVFLFVNAMKSYSLIGSRMMFVLLCIISVLYFRRKNES